jgi:propanol-preferring alcohol dehydrogenase
MSARAICRCTVNTSRLVTWWWARSRHWAIGFTSYAVGDRVGVAWLRHTDGTCAYCRRGNENLCPNSLYTGWDADGGYAEYTTVPAAFAYRLPADVADVADVELAPLLCAGIIGYRALLRTSLPARGRLGLYGFGDSAHLVA